MFNKRKNIIRVLEDNHTYLYDLDVTKVDAIKMGERRKGMKVSLMSDAMMKAMFQNESRIKYSAKLLSYFINVSYEELLKNMHLDKNELDKDKEFSKGERADFVADIGDAKISIEVNNNSGAEIMERNIDFSNRLYSSKVKRGKTEEGNNYEFTNTIQLNINNFAFVGNDKIIDIYGIQNDVKIRLSDKNIIIQIYIPNLMKKWYTEGIEKLTECEKYLIALVEEDIEKLKEFGDDEIMSEYIKEAEDVSFESSIGEAYDKELALKEEARKDGIKMGLEQGSLSEKHKIAKSLLEKNVDINIISESTGLSIEEINSL